MFPAQMFPNIFPKQNVSDTECLQPQNFPTTKCFRPQYISNPKMFLTQKKRLQSNKGTYDVFFLLFSVEVYK